MKALGRPAAVMPTSRGDVEDLHWLDAKVATLGDGIEAAKEIWLNWSDLRCVGRLHPGMTAGDFLASVLGGLRLDVGELVKALPEMSTREIAKVAGVSNYTVAIEKQAVRNLTPDAEPARVVGVDGKSYPGRVVREVTAQVIETEEPRAVIAASRAPTPRHASHATGNAAPRCACESSSCASHGVGAPSGSRRSWLRRGYAGRATRANRTSDIWS